MKTADLIPLILLELNEKDKYGFELTKAIETKSNGQIVIKQPTLYTLLKKLEKSKFISSYWEDSEIGGKRHYYKITQNGKMQISTMPSYDVLLQKTLEESDENNTEENICEHSTSPEERKTSIMDELIGSSIKEPAESIIPSAEVFAETNIDNSTEYEINVSNAEILKDTKTSQDELFATNQDVSKFTEKFTYIAETPASSNNDVNLNKTSVSSNISLDIELSIPKTEIETKYVDYIDFKNSQEYKTSKKLVRNMLYQSLATSATLILMAIICSLITSFTGRSGLYYIFFISAILVAIFYPILYLINLDKLRLKYQETKFNYKFKLRVLIGFALVLSVFLACIIVNICIGKNTINVMLHANNFANIYAPILLASVYFIDLLYYHLFLSKLYN